MSRTTTATGAQTKLLPAINSEISTIDELIKRRAAELKDAPLLGYPQSGFTDYEEHSAQAIDRYVDAAAEVLQRRGLDKVDSSLDKAPVVGILANSSLQFIITLLGLSRLGYATLLLSTRLASPALSSLLELSNCPTILTTSNFHPVLAEVQKERNVTVIEMLKHEDYYGIDAPVFSRTYDAKKETLKQAVIIHSSGSTGMPKPIFLTHRSAIASCSTHLDRRALMTQPLFHSFGFYETFRSIYSGKPMYYYNYSLPITSKNLAETLAHVKPDLLFCVPYILKLLGETEKGIQTLAAIDLVMYGGSACPDDLGDALVKNGVNLVANYGATETGRLMTSVRPPGDKAWNYLRILPQVEQFVLMDEIAPGIHECVALDGLRSKSTINSQNPPNSFRTKDLFTPHPVHRHWWKFVSRLDDRLTLVNGEKVLPIPIEGRIRQETLVKESVVFGDGKTVPGIIIVKADEASQTSDSEYLRQIWPAIEDANSRAESFSRIPQELVVIIPSETIYAKTDKGTFIRAQVYAQFKNLIDAAYAKFESDSEVGGSIALPQSELEIYLLKRFREHIGVDLPSTDTDFFAYGVDSLQGMNMWSLMKRELDLGGRHSELGQNVLYETGNIAGLAQYLHGLRTGVTKSASDHEQVMNNLINKYSSVKKFGEKDPSRKEAVILTGVTGGLGAHILKQLVQKPNVSEVWCFVRSSTEHGALERTLKSLSSRGIQLTRKEISKVVAVPADLSKPDFGLSPSSLEELRSKLTLVIHSAWAVNFNISVQSFEDQHIKAVQSFINFCQSTTHGSPGRFFFCSSVSSAAATPRPGQVPEKQVENIAHVQGTGYARSKYVAEHIVHNSMKDSGADARVLRIGQLAGDSVNGEWNATEGIPLMIQTAVTLGALPALDEEMSWLPVDTAASVVIDLSLSNTDRSTEHDLVYHVLNPDRFHWTRDMLPTLAAVGLKFETLPTDQWMEKLRNSDRDPTKNPPIKLLDWFESKYGPKASTTKKGVLEYLTDETKKDSESFSRIPSITDKAYMTKVIQRLSRNW
ncbi:hypothetical protein B0J11DRAFT_234772 [Dendryphion nanum]|uniref:Acetyl-CoA synthetase-like protein n=1 Tax=Dendryphion nanum TaxID=256645 RepID=A0A9P9CZU8_9PLEO|nr:hypothetical protein B0J11DRAFT_234772 [Dendryphion nanum]